MMRIAKSCQDVVPPAVTIREGHEDVRHKQQRDGEGFGAALLTRLPGAGNCRRLRPEGRSRRRALLLPPEGLEGRYARAVHSISISNSMGQEATGTKVREGGSRGKNRA